MPGNTAIKWVHRLLTAFLLLVVASYVVYQHYVGPPYNDAVFSSRQLNENTWLYVTKYQGGGATVSDVYRYYLSGKIAGDAVKALGEMSPFLTADTGSVNISKIGNLVTVKVTGKVYDFSNSVFYTSDGLDVTPVIELYAINSR
ncbi:hypothetical protein [Edaphovirga cremea]|uniref:hypothetical protein n=1 Tax=Edaphovirga cremea TaxID=2267246 RepID=UPI0039899D22